MTQHRALLFLAVTAVVCQAPTLRGQDPRQTPEVTFQVEVNYVDVDVVVTDEQGNFVTGLTRDDFEVSENGRPQKIDQFSMVGIPVEKPTEFVHEGRPVVADTQSNRKPFDGRVYVLVLDDLDVSAMRSTHLKDAARKFVREYMGANDLAAVVYTSGRKDATQEFTTNRELLIAAIDKFIGQRMRSLSLERLDSYYQQIAFGYTSQTVADPNTGSINQQDPAGYGRVSDPTELERGTRAITVLDVLKNTAEFLGSVTRPPQGSAVFQRRDRLPDSRRLRRPRCDDGDPREPGCDLDGGPRQRQFLRGRSSRPGRHDQRVH